MSRPGSSSTTTTTLFTTSALSEQTGTLTAIMTTATSTTVLPPKKAKKQQRRQQQRQQHYNSTTSPATRKKKDVSAASQQGDITRSPGKKKSKRRTALAAEEEDDCNDYNECGEHANDNNNAAAIKATTSASLPQHILVVTSNCMISREKERVVTEKNSDYMKSAASTTKNELTATTIAEAAALDLLHRRAQVSASISASHQSSQMQRQQHQQQMNQDVLVQNHDQSSSSSPVGEDALTRQDTRGSGRRGKAVAGTHDFCNGGGDRNQFTSSHHRSSNAASHVTSLFSSEDTLSFWDDNENNDDDEDDDHHHHHGQDNLHHHDYPLEIKDSNHTFVNTRAEDAVHSDPFIDNRIGSSCAILSHHHMGSNTSNHAEKSILISIVDPLAVTGPKAPSPNQNIVPVPVPSITTATKTASTNASEIVDGDEMLEEEREYHGHDSATFCSDVLANNSINSSSEGTFHHHHRKDPAAIVGAGEAINHHANDSATTLASIERTTIHTQGTSEEETTAIPPNYHHQLTRTDSSETLKTFASSICGGTSAKRGQKRRSGDSGPSSVACSISSHERNSNDDVSLHSFARLDMTLDSSSRNNRTIESSENNELTSAGTTTLDRSLPPCSVMDVSGQDSSSTMSLNTFTSFPRNYGHQYRRKRASSLTSLSTQSSVLDDDNNDGGAKNSKSSRATSFMDYETPSLASFPLEQQESSSSFHTFPQNHHIGHQHQHQQSKRTSSVNSSSLHSCVAQNDDDDDDHDDYYNNRRENSTSSLPSLIDYHGGNDHHSSPQSFALQHHHDYDKQYLKLHDDDNDDDDSSLYSSCSSSSSSTSELSSKKSFPDFNDEASLGTHYKDSEYDDDHPEMQHGNGETCNNTTDTEVYTAVVVTEHKNAKKTTSRNGTTIIQLCPVDPNINNLGTTSTSGDTNGYDESPATKSNILNRDAMNANTVNIEEGNDDDINNSNKLEAKEGNGGENDLQSSFTFKKPLTLRSTDDQRSQGRLSSELPTAVAGIVSSPKKDERAVNSVPAVDAIKELPVTAALETSFAQNQTSAAVAVPAVPLTSGLGSPDNAAGGEKQVHDLDDSGGEAISKSSVTSVPAHIATRLIAGKEKSILKKMPWITKKHLPTKATISWHRSNPSNTDTNSNLQIAGNQGDKDTGAPSAAEGDAKKKGHSRGVVFGKVAVVEFDKLKAPIHTITKDRWNSARPTQKTFSRPKSSCRRSSIDSVPDVKSREGEGEGRAGKDGEGRTGHCRRWSVDMVDSTAPKQKSRRGSVSSYIPNLPHRKQRCDEQANSSYNTSGGSNRSGNRSASISSRRSVGRHNSADSCSAQRYSPDECLSITRKQPSKPARRNSASFLPHLVGRRSSFTGSSALESSASKSSGQSVFASQTASSSSASMPRFPGRRLSIDNTAQAETTDTNPQSSGTPSDRTCARQSSFDISWTKSSSSASMPRFPGRRLSLNNTESADVGVQPSPDNVRTSSSSPWFPKRRGSLTNTQSSTGCDTGGNLGNLNSSLHDCNRAEKYTVQKNRAVSSEFHAPSNSKPRFPRRRQSLDNSGAMPIESVDETSKSSSAKSSTIPRLIVRRLSSTNVITVSEVDTNKHSQSSAHMPRFPGRRLSLDSSGSEKIEILDANTKKSSGKSTSSLMPRFPGRRLSFTNSTETTDDDSRLLQESTSAMPRFPGRRLSFSNTTDSEPTESPDTNRKGRLGRRTSSFIARFPLRQLSLTNSAAANDDNTRKRAELSSYMPRFPARRGSLDSSAPGTTCVDSNNKRCTQSTSSSLVPRFPGNGPSLSNDSTVLEEKKSVHAPTNYSYAFPFLLPSSSCRRHSLGNYNTSGTGNTDTVDHGLSDSKLWFPRRRLSLTKKTTMSGGEKIGHGCSPRISEAYTAGVNIVHATDCNPPFRSVNRFSETHLRNNKDHIASDHEKSNSKPPDCSSAWSGSIFRNPDGLISLESKSAFADVYDEAQNGGCSGLLPLAFEASYSCHLTDSSCRATACVGDNLQKWTSSISSNERRSPLDTSTSVSEIEIHNTLASETTSFPTITGPTRAPTSSLETLATEFYHKKTRRNSSFSPRFPRRLRPVSAGSFSDKTVVEVDLVDQSNDEAMIILKSSSRTKMIRRASASFLPSACKHYFGKKVVENKSGLDVTDSAYDSESQRDLVDTSLGAYDRKDYQSKRMDSLSTVGTQENSSSRTLPTSPSPALPSTECSAI